MSDTEWIGPAALAAEFDIPVKTVYQWNSKGTGPRAAKIGRHVRYRRVDVEAWIEQQYTGSPAA
jgi:excisionase family DNA binding protein